MKRTPQILPPRQAVVFDHTLRMLRAGLTNQRSFAMEVADRYLDMTAEDERDVPFRITRGGDGDADKKHNGQILGRYLDGKVKSMPANLEDAWVLSLPEPYRSECERDLARRRGMLAVPMPTDDGLQVVSVATLFQEYGELVAAIAPAVADGKFGPEDRPHAHKIEVKGDDVIAAVIGMRRAMRQGIEGGAASA